MADNNIEKLMCDINFELQNSWNICSFKTYFSNINCYILLSFM